MATNTSIFKNRSLVTIGISESVSNTGNWITMMAVYALVVFRGQGNVAESSGIFLAGLLPTLLFSPVAGWLCDRFDRRRLMIASELTSGLVVAGIIFVDEIGWIYALLALQAVSITVMTPARQAVVPDLVGREDLTRANAFLQQLSAAIKIGAPMLAGLVLAVLDPHQAIILDVISFGFSALILSRRPALPPHPAERRTVSRVSSAAADRRAGGQGLGSVLKEIPGLRLLFLCEFLSVLIIVGFDVLAPVFIRDVLAGGESLFGLLIGLIGAGSLAVGILLMVRKGKPNPWMDTLAGILLLSLITGSLALAAGLHDPAAAKTVVLVATFFGGVGNGLVVIQKGTLLQLLSPAGLLGRMSGLFQSTAVAGQLVGILVTPLVVPGLLSMGVFFGFGTAALVLVAAFIAISLRAESRENVQPSG